MPALTQSARLPGPSWDEEVVPALRKRLESESRTLARRMSAVSLSSSGEEAPTNFSALAKSPAVQHSAPPSPFLQSNTSIAPRKTFQYEARTSYDRPIPSSSSRVNGTPAPSKQKPPTPSFQRSRTYSQPYISELTNGKPNIGARRKISGESKSSSDTSRPSPRPSDVKPTRIPIPTRQHSGSSSTHSNPQPASNGNGYFHGSPEPYQSSDLPVVHETRSFSSSRSNLAMPSRPNPGLLSEKAPFKSDSASSAAHSPQDEVPSRSSNESEERPFEHWYRGEVSRNGGVGELRVGKRQEMLEIANYGHTIKDKALNSRGTTQNVVNEGWRQRKRAGSVSRVEAAVWDRDSLHLDDEGATEIGRVQDEHPLTDLDGGSEEISLSEYRYLDMSTVSALRPQSTDEPCSITPTPSMMQRSSSRQQNLPPTRIPTPSSRRSSESRAPTPTTAIGRGTSEPPPVPSTSTAAMAPSKSPSPPPTRQRQQSKPSPAVNSVTPRGRSPVKNSKSRMAAAKATRAKTLAARKEMDEEANRRSVAYYPTPADGDELMDAIPSWTQPVPKEGNWDDVVLPVVARKKGLDGHYEKADGNAHPKKVPTLVAPAPGTFGFDHARYRPPQTDAESIPMDEFGRPANQVAEEQDKHEPHSNASPTLHDETSLPARNHPSLPSPAPFSHYAAANEKAVSLVPNGNTPAGQRPNDDDNGAGCCKCVIM